MTVEVFIIIDNSARGFYEQKQTTEHVYHVMKYDVKWQSYLILSVIFSTSLFPGRPSYSMTVEVFIIINNSARGFYDNMLL